jgi:hypothetical protein
MVITKIQGGLANQIFQWAYGKFLSEEYNTPLYLDLSFFKNQTGGTKREFSLNKFPGLSYLALPADRNIINWSSEKDKTKIQKLYDNFTFSSFVYDSSSHYYLDGYWQSEKYFKKIGDIIRSELSPTIDFSKKVLHLPVTKNNVSLHVRRTDYLTSNGYHPVQSLEYYKEALNLIGEYDNLFIFSDDIEWCKENLTFKKMIFIENFEDVEDLWLMSLCTNHIIANSSFSWWGAWLNPRSNKRVIAPKNWLSSSSNINTLDIIPENWIII